MIFDTLNHPLTLTSRGTRRRFPSWRSNATIDEKDTSIGRLSRNRIDKTAKGMNNIVFYKSILCVAFGCMTIITVSQRTKTPFASRFLRQSQRSNDVKQLEFEDARTIRGHRVDGRFPLHVDSFEEIPHPGILFSGSERVRLLLPKLEFQETLTVPKFWQPDNSTPQGVRKYLGNNGQRIMSPVEAQSIGSMTHDLETIFVSVASYRDSECRPTIESIFARASHPERIRVAVVDQIETEDPKCTEPILPCDEDPTQILCKYKDLIDTYEVRSYLMVGPVLARHIAHRMYRNEYFAMQVDAHVRFTQGWDNDIISQWHATGNEMAVLTTYLTDIADSIDPTTHKSRRADRNMMCDIKYEGSSSSQKHLVLKSPAKSTPNIQGTPMLHPFWSAGFSFARGHFVVQVPYDPFVPMLFQGEESSIAIRAFSYGYDFYAPERSVAFHIFAMKDNIARRNRHKFWENEILYAGALEKSLERIVGITRMAGNSSPTNFFHQGEELYGLGLVRRPEKYFQTFGIHPDLARVEPHLCSFVHGGNMHREFQPHLRGDGMGINYDDITVEFRDPFGSKEMEE